MLTITSYDDPIEAAAVLPGGGFGLPNQKSFHTQGVTYDVGKPSSQQTIRLGHLVEGSKEWGRLKDKDVTHLKYSGRVSYLLFSPYFDVSPTGHFVFVAEDESEIAATVHAPLGEVSQNVATLALEDVVDNNWNRRVVYGEPGVVKSILAPLAEDQMMFTSELSIPMGTIYDLYTGDKKGEVPSVQHWYASAVQLVRDEVHDYYEVIGYAYGSGPLPSDVAETFAGHGFMEPHVFTPQCFDNGPLSENLSGVVALAKNLEFTPLAQYISWHPADFGVLTTEAASSLNYVDGNILLIIQDVVTLKELSANLAGILTDPDFFAIANIVKAFKGGKVRPRAIKRALAPYSDKLFSWIYILGPDIGDLKKVGEGVAKTLFSDRAQRVHSRKVSSVAVAEGELRHTAVVTAEVAQYGQRDWLLAQEWIYLGHRWGMWPELANLYDLLAYSFVLDWFIQFGDLLEQVDNWLSTVNYFPYSYLICSERWTLRQPAEQVFPFRGITGVVDVSYYRRWCTQDLPEPPVGLEVTTKVSKHWLEAGLLAAQRL